MNCAPARFRFVTSPEGKQRLATHAMAGNKAKILAAPCVVIIAYDAAFYDAMPWLFPIRDVRAMFTQDAALAHDTAFRNSSIQGAYLLIAARLLGLDCCPMSGFDQAGVDAEFFSGTSLKANFLCAIGYADDEPFPKLPRLDFGEAAELL